jgi:hypothetical protein
MDLTKAKKLATRLLKKHKLAGWKFSFDSAVRRYGCCNYSKKRITISKKLTAVREEVNVKNTILHEIAHALVGPGHKHNEVWRRMAIKIGCNGSVRGNDARLPPRWIGLCPSGHVSKYWRKPTKNMSCGICYPKYYNESFKIKITKNEE